MFPYKAYRWNNDRLETHYPDKFDLSCLTITLHWANSADDKMTIFLLFLLKIDFGISYKLCLQETICMKCQSLFSWKE